MSNSQLQEPANETPTARLANTIDTKLTSLVSKS